MFQKYSKLCLPGQSMQAAPTEGLTGDFDLRLHHMPEDLELINHKLGDTPLELFMRQGLYR